MLREDLQKEFEDLGMTVSDEVLDKCVTICMCSDMTPEEFVETWMAYALSNLDGADPTVEYITQFERKELQLYVKNKSDVSKNQTKKNTTTPVIYNVSSTNSNPTNKDTSMDVLDVYTTPKGKTAQKRHADSSPVGHIEKKNASVSNNSPSIYTPASFRPDIFSPNTNYSKRTNAGQIVASYGENVNEVNWKNENNGKKIVIDAKLFGGSEKLTHKSLFMYETLMDKAAVLDSTVTFLGEVIENKFKLSGHENHCKASQAEITAIGRICCDTNDGKLNAASVLLEGDEITCGGRSIKLKLPDFNFAIFPGQIIAACGSNPTRNEFVASKIFSDSSLSLPDKLPELNDNTGPMKIFVSAGPYTQSDTLSYKPLEDLIAMTVAQEPDVLILIGPLLDRNHPLLLNGSLAETFEDFYIKLIDSIVKPLERIRTQVIVVASYKEATSPIRYPTPPPFCTANVKLNKIQFIPDPSTLNINGVFLGVTSVDVLMHLGREEFASKPDIPDRLSRLANHLIQQQSYYPLMPPSIDLPVDMESWELYSQLPVTPHILILPSDLRYFIKNISGCVVINPERLSKGMVGGSLAKIEVKPVTNNVDWSTTTHINAQIVKI